MASTCFLESIPPTLSGSEESFFCTPTSPFTVGSEKVTSRISIGIAVAPYDGIDAETLLRKSDTALYSTKRNRRGQYQFFQSELDAKAQQRRAMERELHEAIARAKSRAGRLENLRLVGGIADRPLEQRQDVFLIAADVADQGGISELEHKALDEIAEVLSVDKPALLGL